MLIIQTTKGLTTMKIACGEMAATIFFYGYWSSLGVVFDICHGSDWTACNHGPLIFFFHGVPTDQYANCNSIYKELTRCGTTTSTSSSVMSKDWKKHRFKKQGLPAKLYPAPAPWFTCVPVSGSPSLVLVVFFLALANFYTLFFLASSTKWKRKNNSHSYTVQQLSTSIGNDAALVPARCGYTLYIWFPLSTNGNE